MIFYNLSKSDHFTGLRMILRQIRLNVSKMVEVFNLIGSTIEY